jgi:hypothetical protein
MPSPDILVFNFFFALFASHSTRIEHYQSQAWMRRQSYGSSPQSSIFSHVLPSTLYPIHIGSRDELDRLFIPSSPHAQEFGFLTSPESTLLSAFGSDLPLVSPIPTINRTTNSYLSHGLDYYDLAATNVNVHHGTDQDWYARGSLGLVNDAGITIGTNAYADINNTNTSNFKFLTYYDVRADTKLTFRLCHGTYFRLRSCME